MRPEKIEFLNNIPVKAKVLRIENYPYHWHDALEIIQVLRGSVNISLGNDNLSLKENDIAIVNMNELHRLTQADSENEVLLISIDPNYYQSLLPDQGYLFLYCCSAYHQGRALEKYEVLKNHISRLLKALSETSCQDNRDTILNHLQTMLAYLTYNFDFLRYGYGTVAFEEKQVARLKRIAEYIYHDRNFDSKSGLKHLAAEVDVSLYHLSHDIKSKFGFTFQELLFYSRIEQAAKLLLSSDRRIVDITWECKFSDPKYLIKYFKQCFGLTPSEFRKRYKADNQVLAFSN